MSLYKIELFAQALDKDGDGEVDYRWDVVSVYEHASGTGLENVFNVRKCIYVSLNNIGNICLVSENVNVQGGKLMQLGS